MLLMFQLHVDMAPWSSRPVSPPADAFLGHLLVALCGLAHSRTSPVLYRMLLTHALALSATTEEDNEETGWCFIKKKMKNV